MKKTFVLLLVLVMVFALAACGGGEAASGATEEPDASQASASGNAGGKTFAFPKSEFVPDWAAYTGSGEIVFTDTENTNLENRGVNTYIDGATLDDVKAYVAMLKEQGLTYAAFAEESLEMDEWGSMSWYGVNGDKSFTVSLTLTDEASEINDNLYDTGVHSYNLHIQVANYDYLN